MATANFKKRMLSDYTVTQTVTDDDAKSVSSTSTHEVPAKRLRLDVRLIRFNLRGITDVDDVESALEHLRTQLQVGFIDHNA